MSGTAFPSASRQRNDTTAPAMNAERAVLLDRRELAQDRTRRRAATWVARHIAVGSSFFMLRPPFLSASNYGCKSGSVVEQRVDAREPTRATHCV